MSPLTAETLTGLGKAIAAGEVSCLEAAQHCLDRADSSRDLGGFVALDHDGAVAAARAADARHASGEAIGPLDGIPIALKDNMTTVGLPTTCGSKILEGFVAPYDSTVAARLRAQGAIILGKTNMDEFAMGSSNEHSAAGPAKNPWNTKHVPGGSSGGSAVVVASGSAFGALGSDTGGSIRQPAAFCGVVGLKPTYGRVSRYGLVAFASSLDQIGPITRNVADCATLYAAIAGHDERDSTSAEQTVDDPVKELHAGIDGLRIGLPKQYFTDGLSPAIATAIDEAASFYADAGATIVDVDLPNTEYGIATYYLTCTAEASSNLARYDGVRYGQRADDSKLESMYVTTRALFGAEVRRRIMLGTFALSSGYYDAFYAKAQKARRLIAGGFARAFETVDVLLTPTTPTPAFELGQNLSDPVQMYLADTFTVPTSLAGLPAISIPCGFDDGLPIGMQLIGPAWSEAQLLRTAQTYEAAHDWHQRRPAL